MRVVEPIAGEGQDLAQPYRLEGERAHELLEDVQRRTKEMGTEMQIEDNV